MHSYLGFLIILIGAFLGVCIMPWSGPVGMLLGGYVAYRLIRKIPPSDDPPEDITHGM